jgi:predicted dienelactone hydrolase
MALERILNDPLLAGRADTKRIAAVGHSLGGWTVMELAGARFDPQQFAHDCIQHAELSSCRLMTTLGLDNRQGASHLSSDLQDRRIKAVVALDLGLARGLTTQSLGHIRLPVLILAAGVDSPALPASLESKYLAKALSSDVVTYGVIPGATHFSFMQQCKPQGEALIEQSAPGEGEVCRDGQGVNRNALHNMLIGKISAFLNTALHYHP